MIRRTLIDLTSAQRLPGRPVMFARMSPATNWPRSGSQSSTMATLHKKHREMLTCLTVVDRQLPWQATSSMNALPWDRKCRDCHCAIIPLEAWRRYHGALAANGLLAFLTCRTQDQLRLVHRVTLPTSVTRFAVTGYTAPMTPPSHLRYATGSSPAPLIACTVAWLVFQGSITYTLTPGTTSPG
jgi:hypothetical protein